MHLSVEILDHIFSFLVSHRKTLIACSEDPVLSPIIERHLYHRVTVHIGEWTHSNDTFEPVHLFNLVSKNPRILYYVRTLQVQVEFEDNLQTQDVYARMQLLDDFAETLLMFPVLECIMLTNPLAAFWHWPDRFREALEDRLNLPTVRELHLICGTDFPHSLLDNCKNITNLSLSGDFNPETQFFFSIVPQLKSLILSCGILSLPLLAWAKLHIDGLHSLKCGMSSVEDLSELLGGHSGTLKNLDVDLAGSPYFTISKIPEPEPEVETLDHLLYLSPLSSNLTLEQLTIHTAVILEYSRDRTYRYHSSWLPAAAYAIDVFISSPRHLVLDIDLCLATVSDLTLIDFSPLAILGAASRSIPRVDVYIHTNLQPSDLIRAQLLSFLEDFDDIPRSIKEGVLAIHLEETAPDCV